MRHAIGIRSDNHLVIAQLTNIEIVAVACGKSAAESVDHGLDFTVDDGFLYIKDLTAYGFWQYLRHCPARKLLR